MIPTLLAMTLTTALMLQGSTAVKCRQRLAAFLSEWTLSTSWAQNNAVEMFEKGSCRGEDEHEDNLETCPVVATARAAAQLILPDLYFSSFVAYAVGFWPFVRLAVKELQAAWQWSSGTSVTQASEGEFFRVLLTIQTPTSVPFCKIYLHSKM